MDKNIKMYEIVFDYAQNADLSHWQGEDLYDNDDKGYYVLNFTMSEDSDFTFDDEKTIIYNGKKYVHVAWGEEEESYLLESEIHEELWLLFVKNFREDGKYGCTGEVFKTEEKALLDGENR